jgi:hypothetical protein
MLGRSHLSVLCPAALVLPLNIFIGNYLDVIFATYVLHTQHVLEFGKTSANNQMCGYI